MIDLRRILLKKNALGVFELDQQENIEYIEIDNFHSAVKCFISNNNKIWKEIEVLNKDDKYQIKYTKFKFLKTNTDSIEFYAYIRQYPGLIIVSRPDGFGCRIGALLNAMYISRETGFKFGFIGGKNYDFSRFQPIIDDFENIFSEKFLEEHYYHREITLDSEHDHFVTNILNPKDILELPYEKEWGFFYNFHPLTSSLIKDNNYRSNMKKSFNAIGFSKKYCDLIELSKQIKQQIKTKFVAIHMRNGDVMVPDKMNKGTAEMFWRLFPVEILIEIIERENSIGNAVVLFSPDFDILRQVKIFFKSNNMVYTSEELIEGYYSNIYERDFLELMLMSQSFKIYKSPASLYSELAFYIGDVKEKIEIHKHFNLEEQYHIMIKNHNMINILNPYYSTCYYIYLYFMVALPLKKEIQILIDILNKIIRNNQKYVLGHYELVRLLLDNKRLKEADMVIKDYWLPCFDEVISWILLDNLHHCIYKQKQFLKQSAQNYPYISYVKAFIMENKGDVCGAMKAIMASINNESDNIVFLKMFYRLYLKYFYKNEKQIEDIFLKFDMVNKQISKLDSESQKISHNIKKIQEKPLLLGAPSRIKNHLAYRLGQIAIANSKTIGGYFRLPFNLIKEYKQYNQEQKNYQMMIKINPILALPKLQDYDDYQEAVKIKKYFSYRLGEAIIQANNTWYGGGYIKLWFDIKRLKKEIKRG
ncbi:hypothetical protein ACOW55_000698 [Campylobacter coli]|uniref:hypothetical protein n=1 Tax=Campylobacter coli TaxID=195 RepID=UPI001F35F1EF|nr:hypothetical protein [Campylobacter coli]